MYLATFTSREPIAPLEIPEHSDVIPWGESYVPGSANPPLILPSAGEYTLAGKCAGVAQVNVTWLTAPQVGSISVIYDNYSDDGLRTINGWENVTRVSVSPTTTLLHWYSDLTQKGKDGYLATKRSGSGGFHIQLDIMRNYIESNGTLVTSINGVDYTSRNNWLGIA